MKKIMVKRTGGKKSRIKTNKQKKTKKTKTTTNILGNLQRGKGGIKLSLGQQQRWLGLEGGIAKLPSVCASHGVQLHCLYFCDQDAKRFFTSVACTWPSFSPMKLTCAICNAASTTSTWAMYTCCFHSTE